MLTVPDGSAESFDAHVDWVACNLEYAPDRWAQVRARAHSLDVKVMPWVRLAHSNSGETIEHVKVKLSLLVDTAQAWGCDTILPNYEDEASTIRPSLVAEYLYGQEDWLGHTGWSTNGWLGNDIDYTAIADDPVLLQIFPTDLRWDPLDIEKKMGDCVYHAREKGFSYVGVTYQTYANARPGWYDCASHMHSTYPGNLIAGGDWGKWYQ
jgi:hypothetical protein